MPKKRHATAARPRGGVFVDSSAWVALVGARDACHDVAERLFERATTQQIPLLTTNLVLAEVHRLLLFPFGIRPARNVIERLAAMRLVTIEFADRSHHQAACAWLSKLADQRITYTDAVSFAVMEAAHCTTAFAFDRDFSVAGFSLWQHVA